MFVSLFTAAQSLFPGTVRSSFASSAAVGAVEGTENPGTTGATSFSTTFSCCTLLLSSDIWTTTWTDVG